MIRKEIIRFKGKVHQSLGNIQILPVKLNPDETSCPQCQSEMRVRNVRSRSLITIQHGVVSSRITTLICKNGCKTPDGRREIRRPEELEYLVPSGANIAYDVEVFCGIKRYLEGIQRKEIKKRLEDEHGVFISSRKISILADQFGDPRAVVREFGKGMTPAIEEFVRERKAKIVILGYHTHFIKYYAH